MSTTTLVTADQLLHMPKDGYRYQLVAGELQRMTPAGWRHGDIGNRLQVSLGAYVRSNGLGKVFMAETGFLLSRDPDTVRAPDISFIHKDHLPSPLPEEAYWPGVPDLAVEVVSPGDTFRELDEKVQAWLDAGAKLVWVVNPKWRSVSVYRSVADIKILTENDQLTGEDVPSRLLLPGGGHLL